ncbi:MAG: prepilin peptidase [Geminicoccaceae bacterium]|nr:prepilin peptidase [Geminicoccaceae bacterium]
MSAALCLALFAAFLLLAALEDLRTRRIPNWLVVGVGVLWLPWLIAGPASAGWPLALLLALVAFLAGLLLFTRGILGGGDVKLITVVMLWAGLEHLALFTFVMSLTGGLLAVLSLIWQRYGWMIVPLLVPLQPTFGALRPIRRDGPATPAGEATEPAPVSLPYGIAIAAGGLAVALQHLKLI